MATQTAAQKTAAAKKSASAKTAATKATTAKLDASILASLKTEHPQWAQFVLDNPELKATILKWAKLEGGPTQEMIDAAIYPTKLVQEYNANQQRLDRLKALSPGEYKYEVDNAGKFVDEEIAKQGFAVSPENRQKIIEAALINNWGEGNINIGKAVSAYFDYSKQTLGADVGAANVAPATSGTASNELDKFAQIASDYGIPLPKDPTQLSTFVKQAIGTGSEQAFTDWAKASAISLYPWMKANLEAGGTVKGSLQPIATQIGNVLDITSDQINWQDPKWSGLIAKFDPKTGLSTQQNINDILTRVKTDPQYGYDNTMTAKNSAYDLAASIKSTFGFGA